MMISLIPMATSLSFGLIFATVLVLILAPVFYMILAKMTRFVSEGNEVAIPAVTMAIEEHAH